MSSPLVSRDLLIRIMTGANHGSVHIDVSKGEITVDSVFKEQINAKYGVFNSQRDDEIPLVAEPLEYIDITSIDFGDFERNKNEIAAQLEKDITSYGFFSISNSGIDSDLTSKVGAISRALNLIDENFKTEYFASSGRADDELLNEETFGAEQANGFKPRGYWNLKNNVKDDISFYNIRFLTNLGMLKTTKNHEIILANLDTLYEYFIKNLHNGLLRKLLTLCDIILELPEGFLWNSFFKIDSLHPENGGTGLSRLMLYHPLSAKDAELTGNEWLTGHSDSTAFTFIPSTPIVSLQVRDYSTGHWKYVPYIPNSFIVNVGDAMEFLTGAYFKSAIHRVVQPRLSQQKFLRQSDIYFSYPSTKTPMDPDELNSGKLKRLGYNKPESWEKITFGDWELKKDAYFGVEKELIEGEPKPVLIYGRFNERWHHTKEFSF